MKKIKECKISNEVLVIQEEKAGHFHIWIVPIHEWMNKFDKNVRNIDKIIEYSKQICDDKARNNMNLLLVIDFQNEFINKNTDKFIIDINNLVKSNKYDNVLFTKFINDKNNPTYKKLDWNGCISEDNLYGYK